MFIQHGKYNTKNTTPENHKVWINKNSFKKAGKKV